MNTLCGKCVDTRADSTHAMLSSWRSIARVSTSRIASPFSSSTIADSCAGSVYTAPCTSTVRTSNSDDASTATAPTSTTRIAAAIATQISRLRPLALRTAIRRARTRGSIDPVERAGNASMLPLSSRSLMMIVDRPPESSSWTSRSREPDSSSR